MAAPFGGHSKFAAYLIWASRNGCKVQSLLLGGVPMTKITAPSGKWVFETMDQHEYMTATTVWRLDRRLGLASPFFSVNPKTGENTGDPHYTIEPQKIEPEDPATG